MGPHLQGSGQPTAPLSSLGRARPSAAILRLTLSPGNKRKCLGKQVTSETSRLFSGSWSSNCKTDFYLQLISSRKYFTVSISSWVPAASRRATWVKQGLLTSSERQAQEDKVTRPVGTSWRGCKAAENSGALICGLQKCGANSGSPNLSSPLVFWNFICFHFIRKRERSSIQWCLQQLGLGRAKPGSPNPDLPRGGGDPRT